MKYLIATMPSSQSKSTTSMMIITLRIVLPLPLPLDLFFSSPSPFSFPATMLSAKSTFLLTSRSAMSPLLSSIDLSDPYATAAAPTFSTGRSGHCQPPAALFSLASEFTESFFEFSPKASSASFMARSSSLSPSGVIPSDIAVPAVFLGVILRPLPSAASSATSISASRISSFSLSLSISAQ